jgi:very-short-patch-repair endonuclease
MAIFMENKTKLDELLKCKTFTECANIIYGVKYTNGNVQKKIIEYCSREYNIDIVNIIQQNKEKRCLQCGKVIHGNRKFCSSSCAAKYNNRKRTLSEETKQKISEALQQHSLLKNGQVGKKEYEIVCKHCGKVFTSVNKNAQYCCQQCAHNSEEVKNKIREKAYERIKEGTFSGWQTRNIHSYPEIFWEKVLINNKIPFIKEDFSTKKYFLDFLIERNGKKIDLEIDGRQHKRRQTHDAERDCFLREHGYTIYRIEWNTINNDAGRQKMREKINEFLTFYNNLL